MTLKPKTLIGKESASKKYEIMNYNSNGMMFWETNAEFCNKVFQQCFPFSENGKMHNKQSKKVLTQLIRLIFQGRDAPVSTIALRPLSKRNSVASKGRFWLKIQQLLELNCNRLKVENSLDSCTDLKSELSDEVKWNLDPTTNTPQKIPIVYLKDVLTSQGRVSKSNFMNYFGLQGRNNEEHDKKFQYETNTTMIKLSQAPYIPLSSDLGKIMASKENVELTEEFKLRKIDRYEWYINRPFDNKVEDIEYPVTYVEKGRKKRVNFGDSKRSNLRTLIKLCKPICVKLKLVNLVEMQKKLKVNSRRRWRYKQRQMLKTCKKLRVFVPRSEKQLVDSFRSNGSRIEKK